MTSIPVDIAKRLGGEIVRLWVASVDFREDVVGSEQLMQRVAENYRKIRNTFPLRPGQSVRLRSAKARGRVREDGHRSISTCCARPCSHVRQTCMRWYDEFAFHKIYHRSESTSAWWS